MLTLVTGFFRLRDRQIDEDEAFACFDRLAACGLPIILFLDRRLADRAPKRSNVRVELHDLEALWSFQQPDGKPLPASCTPGKDTKDFLLLQNAKIDLLAVARGLDAASHFAWIDFGIMKVVKREEQFLERLRAIKPPDSCVLAPGCWDKNEPTDTVNWRFCGAFLLADRNSIPALVQKHHKAFRRSPALTWEVNVWAAMERAGQKFDWYKADHDDSIIGGGKRICLTMIVKNERAIIERCLTAALPYIDTWAIADTGSTDGTGEFIEQFFAERKVPGKLGRTTFKNFAQARNESLDLAYTVPGWDYALLIDADMVLRGTLDKLTLTAPAYKLLQRNNSLDYWNSRLVSRHANARYVGVTHEFLSVNDPGELAGLIIDDRNDGGSKGDKAERDIRLLNEGLVAEPNSDRYMFYLANTYRETGRHQEAIQWYTRRIKLGGWDEEVWSSYYGIARSYLALGDEPNLIKACFDTYNYRPTRGEPLKLLAKFFREKGKNESALLVAHALADVDYPKDDRLFVEREVYDYGADQELAIAGFYSKKHREAGYRACADLTVHPCEFVREEARKNFTHYARSAADALGARVQPIDWKPDNDWAPMNPSICITDARRLVLVRTVNYEIADGQYPTKDGSGIIKTKNYVLEMDASWKPTGSVRIEDATNLPRTKFPVEGFEDCRLWRNGEAFFVSTTVRDFTDHGQCEMAVATLDAEWRATAVDRVLDYEANQAQKNWMPIVGRPGWFLYMCDPTIAVERTPAGTVERFRSTPSVYLGHLRGSSHLVEVQARPGHPTEFGDGWLCITHEVVWRPERVYLHRFVRFDKDFRVIALSDPFYFTKVGIEFCAGLARDGHQLVATFGVNDASAHLAFFDTARVESSLNRVP